MHLEHVNIKIFTAGEPRVDIARFIEVFHGWVKQQAFDELLIDVADYRHVPAGPGVVLIGHQADYSFDHAGNRYGLRYNRKAALEGSNEDRFAQALWSAANACRLLQDEFRSEGPLEFSRDEFELFINDRALAPNTPETFASCEAELEPFLQRVLGHDDFRLEHQGDARQRFGVSVQVGTPYELDAILRACSAGQVR